MFGWKLAGDRRFGSEGDTPEKVALADVLAGKVSNESFVEVQAQPIVGSTVRSMTAKGTSGVRVVPARGTGDRLWLVLSGDGGEPPVIDAYAGRLRAFDDLPLAPSVRELAAKTPHPVFVRADKLGAPGGIETTAGDVVDVRAGDRITYDYVDAGHARLLCTFTDKLHDAAAWRQALADAQIVTSGPPKTNADGSIEFEIAAPDAVAATSAKLNAAGLNAARADLVRHHVDGKMPAAWKEPLPAGVDVVGVYVVQPIPSDALALVVTERPDDFWYVTWVLVAIGIIGVVFALALVRAVRRDLLPAR